MLSFKLAESFCQEATNWPSSFADNPLGEIVFVRTYSRNGESWPQCVRRVVEGIFSIQKDHFMLNRLPWNEPQQMLVAKNMYKKIHDFKFCPPGRGLWCLGTPLIHERKMAAAANNCAFVSTGTMKDDPVRPFSFLMDCSMCGVGVGFDAQGAGQIHVHERDVKAPVDTFIIPDTREGWVESLVKLLSSFFYAHRPVVHFDYSAIRAKGEALKAFGGVASGSDPLREMHEAMTAILQERAGSPITSETIVDLGNLCGKCVVSGNVRRSALIALGSSDDANFLNLKNYKLKPHRESYGWSSNNSIYAQQGMNYTDVCERIVSNGEPGFCWLDNVQAFSRMCDPPDFKDIRAIGVNPCVVGDTLVETSEGVRKVLDLIGIPFKAVVNGKSYSSSGFWKTGRKPVVKLRLNNGFSLRLTPDHRVLTDTGFTPAQDLKEHRVILNGNNSVDAGSTTTMASISDDGVEDVYDCTVNVVHQFSANGVLVHNCVEQSLENFELCTLVETFPAKHDSLEDFLDTLRLAFLYAKTITLLSTHWVETNAVMQRNRRIGTSVSGIAQFLAKHGLFELKQWLTKGYEMLNKYDVTISEQFGIPVSIKKTSVKPSGTVSLLSGATPGMHWPESQYYIRRVRLTKDSVLCAQLADAGYPVEDCVGSEKTTSVVEIPVCAGENIRTLDDVSIWEQVSLAAFLQKYWSDNAVSSTISFDPDGESSMLEPVLDYFQFQLKGISFLPRKKGAGSEPPPYPQMPYEKITAEEYLRRKAALRCLHLSSQPTVADYSVISSSEAVLATGRNADADCDALPECEKFCTNAGCALP